MRLDLCPSYPSKSQEERGRLELLERKRKKRPLGLDGCDKRHLSLILFLVPSALPFLQVIRVADSPLAALPTPPVSFKSRLANYISGDFAVGEAASLLLPAGSYYFPLTLEKQPYTPLLTILLSMFLI